MSLSVKILLFMVIGAIVGSITQLLNVPVINQYVVEGVFHVGGKLFINALKMLMVPLVFVSIVCGVCSLADPKKLGRLSLKTIGLYLLTTALALILAISLASIFPPGSPLEVTTDYVGKQAPPLSETFINLIPTNPIAALANGNMLQIIIFSVFLGLAILYTGKVGEGVRNGFNSMNEVMLSLVNIVMKFAPYGVFFLIAKTFATFEFSELVGSLGSYFGLVIIALILHALITYSSILTISGLNPIPFFKGIWPAMVTAFGTSSSSATLPVTMRCAEKNLGVNRTTYSFTLPLGATINMDGTAIMQGVATLFIAQMSGIDLSMAQLATVVITATLASIGTAGVPGVGLVMLVMVLDQVGLPSEAIGMIIGIDRLLDMTRTAVNISGDAAVTAVVAKSEGDLDTEVYYDTAIHSNFDDK